MKRWELLLVQLGEEANEVAQEAAKCLRFGPGDVHPAIGISNVDRIVRELNDLYTVVDMLIDEGVFPKGVRRGKLVDAKRKKVEEMLTVSAERGRLEL